MPDDTTFAAKVTSSVSAQLREEFLHVRIDAESWEAAEHHIAADPLRVRGRWERVTVHRIDKRTERRSMEGAA